MAEAEALQELEDEIPGQDDMAKAEDAERERMKAALFGEDEEEDLGAEAAALEEEMDGEGGEEAAPAAGPSSQSQRREMLKALAKKRKADEEAEVYGPGGKKSKKSKKSKDDKKGKQPKASSRSERVDAAGPAEDDGEERLEDFIQTEADLDFIDDEGAEEVERFDGGAGGDAGGWGSEAEEDMRPESEIDGLLARAKKTRHKEDEGANLKVVEDLIAAMEVAAEGDAAAHEAGRPAVQKLKMLAAAEEVLLQVKYHMLFIGSGGLVALRAWLEPYRSSGALPNVRLRSSLLKVIAGMAIDTAREVMKEQLKKSGLATVVKFYSLCPDELLPNRRLAEQLCQRWAAPLFLDPQVEERKRRQKEAAVSEGREVAAAKAATAAAAESAAMVTARRARPGEPGFRWHAAIPASSKLDYVKEPQGAVAAFEGGSGKGGKKEDDVFAKKMREVARKNKASTSRAMLPSAEGRGMVMFGN